MIFIVVVVAHCPAVGVNVYVAVPIVAVLIAGDHVPVNEFNEVVGKALKASSAVKCKVITSPFFACVARV